MFWSAISTSINHKTYRIERKRRKRKQRNGKTGKGNSGNSFRKWTMVWFRKTLYFAYFHKIIHWFFFLLLALKVSGFIQTYVIGNCRSFSNFRCPTATGTSGPSGWSSMTSARVFWSDSSGLGLGSDGSTTKRGLKIWEKRALRWTLFRKMVFNDVTFSLKVVFYIKAND